jgi:subtilisin family serine protease
MYPAFPAAFGMSGQITVGASTFSERLAGFSNYSTRLVNLVAPGVDIFSTYPGNRTAYLQGTSMATPFVAGAAALLWGFRPQATASQVREALLNSVDRGPYSVSTNGRLNIERALAELARILP